MKLVIALLLSFSSSAFAVTPYQRKVLRKEAYYVMMDNGAESILAPEVLKLNILSENEYLIEVQFTGIEWGPYRYNCKFAYDVAGKAVVKGSDSCVFN